MGAVARVCPGAGAGNRLPPRWRPSFASGTRLVCSPTPAIPLSSARSRSISRICSSRIGAAGAAVPCRRAAAVRARRDQPGWQGGAVLVIAGNGFLVIARDGRPLFPCGGLTSDATFRPTRSLASACRMARPVPGRCAYRPSSGSTASAKTQDQGRFSSRLRAMYVRSGSAPCERHSVEIELVALDVLHHEARLVVAIGKQ
jgi:hypothetical protein